MLEVKLTYPTPEGSEEVPLDGGNISMGRGSDADLRFDDDGLSRLHASVYREGDRIWVLDEGSTNGTFVNGNPVAPSGTPLRNGDSIKIGHYTNIRVFISEKKDAPVYRQSGNPVAVSSNSAASPAAGNFHLLPIALIIGAVLVIGVSAIVIGVKVFGNNEPEIVRNNENSPDDFEEDKPINKKPSPSPTKTETTNKTEITPTPAPDNSSSNLLSKTDTTGSTVPLSTGKKYQQMSDGEKNQYIQLKAMKVAGLIGNQNGEPVPPEAIARIRRDLEGYVSRLNRAPVDNCAMGSWLKSDMNSILKRATKNAPIIISAFYKADMDPQVGLYLAMIESEHCLCLNSNTGPVGIFQFTTATAKTYFPNNGAGVIKGADANHPDIRCDLTTAAEGSANYMKFLTGFFGTGPQSILLAIGSYNSGEGAGAKNLREALKANSSQERSFWTLVANADKLPTQFQRENVKYVPKFFAAAIIGENPQDFGVSMIPLSNNSGH